MLYWTQSPGEGGIPLKTKLLRHLEQHGYAGRVVSIRHLDDLRERHGWLYKELAEHPRVAQLLDELALFGL